MFISKRMPIIGIAIILVLFGATMVLAQGDEIHACVNPFGHVRIVQEAESCLPKEIALSWNTQGPQGEKGEKGDTGTSGPPGISGYEVVQQSRSVGPGGLNTIHGQAAVCQEGKTVIGGGYHVYPFGSDIVVYNNSPFQDSVYENYWWVNLSNLSSWDIEFTTFAICAYVMN